MPTVAQPQSSASDVTMAVSDGSEVAMEGEAKDDDAHGDSNKNKNADVVDAARHRDVEKEIARNLSRPLAAMKITEERPDSIMGPRSNINMNLPIRQQNNTGANDTARSMEVDLLNSIASDVDKLKKLKAPKVGIDDPDASALPNPNFVAGGQAMPVVQDVISVKNTRDDEERNERVRQIFTSEDEIKGRLKVLTEENVKDLLRLCDERPIDKGGFGEIFVCKYFILLYTYQSNFMYQKAKIQSRIKNSISRSSFPNPYHASSLCKAECHILTEA